MMLDEASHLAGTIRAHCQDVADTLGEEMQTAPYRTLGAAGGVGFVLGSILRAGAIGAVLDIGARLALASTLARIQGPTPEPRAAGSAPGEP